MMNQIWQAVRSVLAVLAGIFVMSVIAFAIEIPLMLLALQLLPETFPDQDALNASLLWKLSQLVYTLPASIFGGYIAAWLAPRSGMAHGVAMAIVQELLIVALMFNPPHPIPAWQWAIALTLTPIAIIYGGYLRSRRETPLKSAQPAAADAGES